MEGLIQSFPEGDMRESLREHPEIKLLNELEGAQGGTDKY